MDSSSSEDDFVALFLLKKGKRKRKILGPSNPEISPRGRRVSPPYQGVAKLSWPEQFKIYLRMSVEQFDALLAIQEPHIKKKTTNFREPIDPEQRLAVCLRYGHTHTRPAEALGRQNRTAGFCRSLARWLWIVKHHSKYRLWMRKTQKIEKKRWNVTFRDMSSSA